MYRRRTSLARPNLSADPIDKLPPELLTRLAVPGSARDDPQAWADAASALCRRDKKGNDPHLAPNPPACPDEAEPGSAKKVAVMECRVNAGWKDKKTGVEYHQHDGPPAQCFHPRDGGRGWVRLCFTSNQNKGRRAGVRRERLAVRRQAALERLAAQSSFPGLQNAARAILTQEWHDWLNNHRTALRLLERFRRQPASLSPTGVA